MSFIGTLVLWRRSGDIEGPVAAELEFQPFQERGAAWSHAAGLDPDPAALRKVFSVGMSTEIFLGLKLFDGLLPGLGLPPSEDPEPDEDS